MVSYKVFVITLLILVTSYFLLFYLLFKLKKSVNEKNVRLIQYYLDMKFINKSLLGNLNVSNPSVFCKKLIDDIKEYYNLEDIIIIDSIRMVNDERNTALRAKVIDYIADNIQFIEQQLQDKEFLTVTIGYNVNRCVLHISSIMPQQINDGLIICIENSPSLLSENEVASLENILNLLKTRLVYS